MLPASRAAWVPDCMATPTSACAKRWRIIGAVAAHGDHPSRLLLAPDVVELVLGRCLGDEIVDTSFRRDGRCCDGIVAGDHDCADAHGPQGGKALLDVGLHHILQVNDAEQAVAVCDTKRCSACARYTVHRIAKGGGRGIGSRLGVFQDGIDRTFADTAAANVDTRNAGCRGEGHRFELRSPSRPVRRRP